MRFRLSVLANAALAAALLAAAPARAAEKGPAEIPVDRVVLSTSGLADFELKAKVTGDAALEFPVRLRQVDDILKSLVVFDKDGSLGGVTLPGQQPLAEVFKDLPFTRAQLSDSMMLLNAYQGAELKVKGAALSDTGRIVRVAPEQVTLENGAVITRHRLTLLTEAGMRQAVLEDLDSFEFTEEKPRREIARALAALRENASSDRRMLTVNLNGPADNKGPREVRLAYVVDAPLWKSAYRLVLPKDGKKETALMQGWAVIENMTAGDWTDVDLTLVSGNPVTYRQALYTPYYVDRPDIPVQVFGRVMPRVDTGALAMAESDGFADDALREEMAAPAAKSAMKRRMAAPSPAPMAAMDMAYGGASSMETISQAANAAQSSEATTQVLFRFPERFSLKSGESMMLPFVSRGVPMRKVALYQPETHATHPLAAVELTNDGESGLPPGILTLYEDGAAGTTFVGDAQLPVLAKGEKRLISYALDSKTDISREEHATSTEDSIRIAQGVLNTSVIERRKTAYTIKAPAAEARTVILEQPKLGPDYKIVSPDPKTVELTETHYRVAVPVKAGETAKAEIVLERQLWQSVSINGMPTDTLLAYARSRGNLTPETRAIFRKLADLRRALDAVDREIAEAERQRRVIFEDQSRVRENLKSLEGKSNVKDKYLEKLGEQEERLEKIDARREDLAADRKEKLEELNKMIATIRI